jgi:hypothetical protein
MLLVHHGRHGSRDRCEDVDGRIVVALGERAREDDVAVQDRTNGVGDRLGHVVAFDQDCEEAGDGAVFGVARPLEQSGQEREDRRRVPTQRGRLPCPETDLALGHGQPGDRVHHEQDILAVVPERLRDRRGDFGGFQAKQGRLVRSGDYDAGTRQAFGPELLVDEFLNLAASFADQSDHVHVGGRVAGDHRQERGLAHAGAGEDPEALALPGGQESVEGPHAGRDRRGDPRPSEWMRSSPGDDPILGVERALAVQRPPEAVQNAAKDCRTYRDAELLLAQPDRGAGPYSGEIAERNQCDPTISKTDDFGADHAFGLEVYPADRPELKDQARRLHGRADDAHDFAGGLEARRGLGRLQHVAQHRRNAVVVGEEMTASGPLGQQRAAALHRARHSTPSSSVPLARLGMARSRAMPISSS